ncbi:MAG: glycosyltransferase N-terminal domain-containing protein [bacterium]
MRTLYTFTIRVYIVAIRLAAFFNNKKAGLWISGRKNNLTNLKNVFENKSEEEKPVIWVHGSSLGEFEQGRPVIEKIKKTYPQYRILLTFFSPSGYEIRKNYEHADIISYLPPDIPVNVREFLNIVKPSMAFFIKYDYWFNFLSELKSRSVPVFIISALFRPGQYFFQWYGKWFLEQLGAITWFFVQNEESLALLKESGKTNSTMSGDTRFDRVAEISSGKKEFPLIREFCGNDLVLLAGSTWKEDENLLLPFFLNNFPSVKFIIAPHDTSPERVREICARFEKPFVKFSDLNADNSRGSEILVIDTIGILAHLYQYATVSYIGGGFGVSIHNIQEPIAFGIPVLFGPNYKKFREAVELIPPGGASSVKTTRELGESLTRLFSDKDYYRRASDVCRKYVEDNRGATSLIIRKIISLGIFPQDPGPLRGDPDSKTNSAG